MMNSFSHFSWTWMKPQYEIKNVAVLAWVDSNGLRTKAEPVYTRNVSASTIRH